MGEPEPQVFHTGPTPQTLSARFSKFLVVWVSHASCWEFPLWTLPYWQDFSASGCAYTLNERDYDCDCDCDGFQEGNAYSPHGHCSKEAGLVGRGLRSRMGPVAGSLLPINTCIFTPVWAMSLLVSADQRAFLVWSFMISSVLPGRVFAVA